jgi:hypothetical protein
MSTIVAIMDRPGFASNTDVLVLVEPHATRLLWVPRDVWCPGLKDRINTAFRSGGHDYLLTALLEHHLGAEHSLCLSREATEAGLAGARVVVPVPVPMSFEYPLHPTARIEDGRKTISFSPPFETLQGERIHQWLGARGGTDMHRLERQKVFLRRLLQQRYDFSRFLANPAWADLSSAALLDELMQVRHDWRFETMGSLWPAIVDGKQVLLRQEHGLLGTGPLAS